MASLLAVLKACLTGTMRTLAQFASASRTARLIVFVRKHLKRSIRCSKHLSLKKAAHLTNQGISNVFDDPEVAAFAPATRYQGLGEGDLVIELFALKEMAKLSLSSVAERRPAAVVRMFNSYTPAKPLSPGLILLTTILLRHTTKSSISIWRRLQLLQDAVLQGTENACRSLASR